MRLRRSDLEKPGFGRRRSGKGFRYLGTTGEPLKDKAAIQRIRALVIPPAWQDVWISPDPRGHIQAVGVDAAGRRQYRYHDEWRIARDRAKFDHMVEVAERLPELRDRLCTHLTTGRGLSRDRVLAAIIRLLDMGMFRVGSAQYADRDEDPSYGLSTLRPEHVRTRGKCVMLQFPSGARVGRGRAATDRGQTQECRRPRHEGGRRTTRQHTGSRPRVLRRPTSDRALRRGGRGGRGQ
jgi:DNA topoisomerase IB